MLFLASESDFSKNYGLKIISIEALETYAGKKQIKNTQDCGCMVTE